MAAEEDTTLVEWEDWDDETFDAEGEEIDRDKKFGREIKVEAGFDEVLRFLPAPKGKGSPFVRETNWWLKDDEGKFPVLDVAKHFKLRDPIDTRLAALETSGNRVDAQAAAKFRNNSHSTYVYCNVIIRGKEEGGPETIRMSAGCYAQLRDIRTDFGNFVHPIEGYDIRLKRTGSGIKDTKYRIVPINKAQPTPLPDFAVIGEQRDVWARIVAPDRERMERAVHALEDAFGGDMRPALTVASGDGAKRLNAPKTRTAADDIEGDYGGM